MTTHRPRGPIEPDLASVASLLGDPSRAAMVMALLGGRPLAAGTLAAGAGVSPQTASAHLQRLAAAGIVRGVRDGRHKLFSLADVAVAEAVEALVRLAAVRPVRSLRDSARLAQLRRARSCYDHLAGELGVAVTGAMLDRGWLAAPGQAWRLTALGERRLRAWGVTVPPYPGRRPALRPCLDWSEREEHLAGGLGARLLSCLLARGWLTPLEGTRALHLTAEGRLRLERDLGVALP